MTVFNIAGVLPIFHSLLVPNYYGQTLETLYGKYISIIIIAIIIIVYIYNYSSKKNPQISLKSGALYLISIVTKCMIQKKVGLGYSNLATT